MAWGNIRESNDIFESLDALEHDSVRALLASVLIEETDLDIENIYSLLFQDGSAIMWH
jgi:hypothetical protein